MPLMCFAHGAGGSRLDVETWEVASICLDEGWAVLAVDSCGSTWSTFGARAKGMHPDTEAWNAALEYVNGLICVDDQRVCMGGFSDGASWALSMGIVNGDKFSKVVAFSPGRLVACSPIGSPDIFIFHGTRDRVLSLAGSCGIVEELRGRNSRVTLETFDGDHIVSRDILEGSFRNILRAPVKPSESRE